MSNKLGLSVEELSSEEKKVLKDLEPKKYSDLEIEGGDGQ